MDLARNRVRELSTALSVAVVVLGTVVLFGWAFGIRALTNIAPPLASMKPATALGFVLVGVGTAALRRTVVFVALVSLAVVAGLSVIADSTSTGLGVDWLIVDHRFVLDLSGRMALMTAASLLLLALGGITRRLNKIMVSQVCSATAFVIGWTACLGYLYGSSALYQIGAFSTVAVHTAIGLTVASIAALAAVPDGLLAWTLSGRDPGAVTMRRVLFLAVFVLPALGAIQLVGRRDGWFEYPFATALSVGVSAVLLLVAVGTTARRLRRADLTRTRAELSLLAINATLEQKVDERSQALARERARMAVFRERDRIAADLHDNVVQTLFGAGLQLDLLQTQVPDPGHSARITSSIDDIHTAIAALRGSIFELKNPGAPTALHASLAALTVRAGRLMPRAPGLTVTGSTEDVPIDIAQAVLAVCQEALANVARHANASRCQVDVHIERLRVMVCIVDDGRSMPAELLHSSGVENIADRARGLGGQARWQARSPHGTTLTWTVPIPDPAVDVPSAR